MAHPDGPARHQRGQCRDLASMVFLTKTAVCSGVAACWGRRGSSAIEASGRDLRSLLMQQSAKCTKVIEYAMATHYVSSQFLQVVDYQL